MSHRTGAKRSTKRVMQLFGEAGANLLMVSLDSNGGCQPHSYPEVGSGTRDGVGTDLFFSISGLKGNLLQDMCGHGRGSVLPPGVWI